MEQTLTDTLNNIIVFKYDESTDSVSVKNSAISDKFMEVVKNTDSLVVEFDVIMIPDFLEYDTWSDDETKRQLKLFWHEHKVTK